MEDFPKILRNWRKAQGLKQGTLASRLGVSQVAVSRWETGLDLPSSGQLANVRTLINDSQLCQLNKEISIVNKMPGLRALVELDGMKLLATSQAFREIWPDMVAAMGQNLGDHLVGLSCTLYNDINIVRSIRANEIAMIAAVSDRHLDGFGDQSFRHYWAAIYKKHGTRYFAEITFEACDPDAELGLRYILKVDEIS